jgi:RNA-directed DNA polymerase
MTKYELTFEEHSYGFRPEKNIHKAVKHALKNIASISAKLKSLDEWLRNRFRYIIWSAAAEKKPERKRKNLTRLGVDQDHAYAWSRTRKGGWAVAQSPILITTITLSRLRQKRYESML